MAEDFKVTYEVPGFERRRPQRSNQRIPIPIPPQRNVDPEIIVISSGDEEEESPRVYPNRIKVEDIKPDLSMNEFNPTASSSPYYAASFTNPSPIPSPSPSVSHPPFLSPNQSTRHTASNGSTRTYAVKSTARNFIPTAPTATIQSAALNQTLRAFEPEITTNTTQPFTTNEIRRSCTPSGRESVFTKGSTPESGFVDQLFEDYQSEIDRDFILPQPPMKTVWSSKQGYKGTASKSIPSKSVEQPNSKAPISPDTIQFTSNEQRQPNVQQTEKSSKTLPVDPEHAQLIVNSIQQAFLGMFSAVSKKEVMSDQDENELLQEIVPPSSPSSSSGTMCEPESDNGNSNQQRSDRKRISNEKPTKTTNTKRRKQSNDSERSSSSNVSSDSYRPASDDEYDEDDDDEDVDSTISNDTEPMAGTSRSPQYEPESDLGTFICYLNIISLF